MNKEKLIEIAKFVAKLLITSGALYMVSRQIEIEALKSALLESNLAYLLLALMLFLLAKLAEAKRTNLFFRAIEVKMSEAENTKLYLLGMFYNLFLPGGIGGDSYRVYWIKNKFQKGLKSIITAFLVNRVNGLMALVALLCISGIYVTDLNQLLGYAYFLIPIMLLVYHLLVKRFFKVFSGLTLSSTTYSLIIQMLQVASAHFVLIAFGIQDGLGVYWFIFLLSGIAFIVPVTVGGIGSRELVFLYGSQLLPIDLNACIALSLIIYCMRAFVSLGGAYFLMYPDKIIDKS